MSPRKNNRRPKGEGREPAGGGRLSGFDEREEGPDGDWIVRAVSPVNAVKPYRCPGCDQEIPPGVGHVVVWPAGWGGTDDRRHWHRACWEARLRRTPRTQRSRNGPRY